MYIYIYIYICTSPFIHTLVYITHTQLICTCEHLCAQSHTHTIYYVSSQAITNDTASHPPQSDTLVRTLTFSHALGRAHQCTASSSTYSACPFTFMTTKPHTCKKHVKTPGWLLTLSLFTQELEKCKWYAFLTAQQLHTKQLAGGELTVRQP